MENLIKPSLQSGARYRADALDLLAHVDDGSAACAFLDPQYRGVLDKLKFGNEGARQKGRAKLPQMDDGQIRNVVYALAAKLKPGGYLFLWVDKYHLVQGDVMHWTAGTDLAAVDLITWDKVRMGMGYRSRRQTEHLLVLQRPPFKPKTTWTDRSIRDVWTEGVKAGPMTPHVKPIGLIKRLILATTHPGDLVLDPCAGSFVTATAASATDRISICGDKMTGQVLIMGVSQ